MTIIAIVSWADYLRIKAIPVLIYFLKGNHQLDYQIENEREVIRRCQNGDLAAFALVYRHFEQPLLRLGLRMLGQQQDAEDALQTTFLKLYRSLRNFRFDSKFGTYLFRIMVNVCFDMRRKRNMKKIELNEVALPSFQADLDLQIQLEQAIRILPERMRACFVLFAIEGLKQNDIAEILELSVGAVKSHVFHAKARLRKILVDTSNEVSR